MKFNKNFEKLKLSKSYNISEYIGDYIEKNDLLIFIMLLENVDLNCIKFRDKKELLNVLEYIFQKYRLFLIKWNYLNWYFFINNYFPFLIWEREYLILEKILILKNQLWWYYKKHYNFYYNIALDYINKYKIYNYYHLKVHKIKNDFFDKTNPNFLNFPWDYSIDDKWFITRDSYMKIEK